MLVRLRKLKKKITNQMSGNELLKKGTSVLWVHNCFDANLYGPWIWIRVSKNLFVSVCFYKIVFFFSFVQLIETTEVSLNCIHIYHAFAIKESQQWSKWKFQTGICMDKDKDQLLCNYCFQINKKREKYPVICSTCNAWIRI